MQRFATIAIAAQWLALVRTLSEVFRLKYYAPDEYTIEVVEPFVGASLFTAVLVAGAVVAFRAGRYRTASTIAVMDIAGLLVYRIVFM